jgi:hypothetical protein
MLTVHTIEYFSHTCNLYYRIFLSSSQCTLSNTPIMPTVHTMEIPIMITIHTLSNIPSCWQSTLYQISHHAYTPHLSKIFRSSSQCTPSDIPIMSTVHPTEHPIMLTVHTIEYFYHACSSHYRIFLSSVQSTVSNVPSCLPITPWNGTIIPSIRIIEYFYHTCSSHYQIIHHTYNSHRQIFLSYLQFTRSNVPSCLHFTLLIEILHSLHRHKQHHLFPQRKKSSNPHRPNRDAPMLHGRKKVSHPSSAHLSRL